MKRTVTFALFTAFAILPPPSPAQNYAAEKGWYFKNFKTALLPWDVYRDAFIGIPPNNDPWSSAFDVLFYDQVYKDKLAKDGNCFGMSLLSLMILKKGGHLGFCQPVTQYSGDVVGMGAGGEALGPTEPMLKRAINVMVGHQVNLPMVQSILDVFAQHKNRNGSYAFAKFQQAHMSDLTLVSITKSLSPDDGGHTLVAYDAQDLGTSKKIFIYDANRSWADSASQSYYTGAQNFILINGNSWTFTMAGGEVWSGDPGSGGNILVTPISIPGPHSRSPASLGDQIIGRVLNELMVTGANAAIEQVTDSRGKRLFKPGTKEIDDDPSSGMLTMIPWYPSDQATGTAREGMLLFHIGGTADSLTVSVRAGSSGYTLSAGGNRSHVTVKALGGGGLDQVTLHQAGAGTQRVSLANYRGTAEYEVEFVQASIPNQQLRVLRSSRIEVPQGATIALATADQHRALSIDSPSDLVRYDLDLQTVTMNGTSSLTRKGVLHQPGLRQTVRPRDWTRLSASEVVEEALPIRAIQSAPLTIRMDPAKAR